MKRRSASIIMRHLHLVFIMLAQKTFLHSMIIGSALALPSNLLTLISTTRIRLQIVVLKELSKLKTRRRDKENRKDLTRWSGT